MKPCLSQTRWILVLKNQVDLGAKTTSRTPQRMVKRLLDLRLLASSQPGMVQILGFSGNSTDRPRASTVEVLSVAGPIAGSETLEAVQAQHV